MAVRLRVLVEVGDKLALVLPYCLLGSVDGDVIDKLNIRLLWCCDLLSSVLCCSSLSIFFLVSARSLLQAPFRRF